MSSFRQQRVHRLNIESTVSGTDHVLTVFSLDQLAIVAYICRRSLCLFAGCRAQICSVLVNVLLRVNINTGNFYRGQYFLMLKTVIPAQVIKSFTIHKIIFLGVFKDIPKRRRQETYLNSRVGFFRCRFCA